MKEQETELYSEIEM